MVYRCAETAMSNWHWTVVSHVGSGTHYIVSHLQ